MSEQVIEYVTVWKNHEPTKLHWGVPIVRCRDCKHYVHSELLGGNACDLQDDYNEYHWLNVKPDGFCAWGEGEMDE